jgi:Leucine Rich repeat
VEYFAIILEEELVEEAELALLINKLTKVVSVLIQAVEATSLAGHNNTSGLGDAEVPDGNAGRQQPSFDPTELVETARQGIRLDLGLTTLSTDDVKVITLVLSGKVAVQQIIPMVKKPVLLAFGIRGIVEANLLETDNSKRHVLTDPRKLPVRCPSPPISVLNLSCTYIGDVGIEMLAEVIYVEGSALKTLDLSYCCISERGFSSLAGAIRRRNSAKTRPIKCLILSGNYLNVNAAYAIGGALASEEFNYYVSSQQKQIRPNDQCNTTKVVTSNGHKFQSSLEGLLVLHTSNASMTAHAAFALIKSLGIKTPIREFNLSSNVFGKTGAIILSELFAAHYKYEDSSDHEKGILPFLEQLDLSNNGFGDEGATEVSKAFRIGGSSKLLTCACRLTK